KPPKAQKHLRHICPPDTNVFRKTPTAYARAAAIPPTSSVATPDRHQETVDQRLFTEPMAKKTAPVRIIETMKGRPIPIRKGSKGTRPQSANALNVVNAAVHADRGSSGKPYSSVNIVRTQRSGSEVIKATMRSRSSPAKPFAAKIWRISSRSPSG